MSAYSIAALNGVTDFLAKHRFSPPCRDSLPTEFDMDDAGTIEDNMYDLDELEEVFADHLLMSKRLCKTLYAGDIEDLNDLPDHPPIALTGLALELFSKAVPNYGLDILDMDYVSSASEAARISPCAMIVALIYLERLQMKNSDYLETVSPSGLFVVTMLVASKFLFENEEDIVTNQLWAEALNFDVKDLNHLEQEFLSAIEWRLFVDTADYFRYLSVIEKSIAVRQSSQRGWLSYSDVYAILQDAAFRGFWSSCFKRLMKVTVLWAVGYAATAFALYGTAVTVQKCTKANKFSSKEFLIKNDSTETLKTPNIAILSSYISDQESSDPLLSVDNPQLHSLVFELSAQKQVVRLKERKGHQHVCHSLDSKTLINSPNVLSQHSSGKLKTSYSPHSEGHFINNKLILINRTILDNLHWLQINKQNSCISVLVR